MGKYIKYKRFVKDLDNERLIQGFLDELIVGDWEIIYYNETPKTVNILTIIVVVGKRRKEPSFYNV